jgi:hypothetical protein
LDPRRVKTYGNVHDRVQVPRKRLQTVIEARMHRSQAIIGVLS